MTHCFYCLFFVSMLIGISCTNNHQNASTTIEKQNLDTADERLARNLDIFCFDQVVIGEIASRISTNKAVKDFSKHNVNLYKGLGNILTPILVKYNIKLSVTTSDNLKIKVQKLKEIQRKSFAHAYLLQMLKDHNAIIRETNAAKNIQCAPLKTFVISNQAAIIKQAYALSALKDATP